MLWDGECGMCSRAAAWAEKRDKAGLIRACAYQDCPVPPMTPELYAACEFAVHTVDPDGRVLRAGRACMHLLGLIGHPTLGRILSLPPFIWFVEIGYKIVAANRPFLSNFMFTKGEGSPRKLA